MGVLLDPRDGSSDLLKFFPPNFAQVSILPSADVMGVGNGPEGAIVWGVEVKKIGDALKCMQDGRLAEQLGNMHEEYDWKFLLIQGETRSDRVTGNLQVWIEKQENGKWRRYWADAMFGKKKKIAYQHFMSWLFSVCLCSNTFLLQARGAEEAAECIVALQRQLAKDWEDHSSLKVFNDSQGPGMYVPSIPMKVARDLAQGVGWEKGAEAADHFKTVRAMANATEEQWREVQGFDKVLAQRCVEGATTPHVLRKRTKGKR